MKKVIILVDMEGCCEISSLSNYSLCLKRMVEETDFVIKTLQELGKYDITVLDCHDEGKNLSAYCLENNIPLINHVWSYDKNFRYDMAFLIGFHGKSGELGYLSHTVRDEITRLELGKRQVGEVALLINWLAYYGIPVVFVSGDASIQSELIDYHGVFVSVKSLAVGTPSLQSQMDKIRFGIKNALSSNISHAYIPDSIRVVFQRDGLIDFIPPELFYRVKKSILFKDTIELIEKIKLLCLFINISNQYHCLRIEQLKKKLSLIPPEDLYKNDEAKYILCQKNPMCLTDDDFFLLHSLADDHPILNKWRHDQ